MARMNRRWRVCHACGATFDGDRCKGDVCSACRGHDPEDYDRHGRPDEDAERKAEADDTDADTA